MLHLLKKLRKTNTQYFKYALGEIILVVIGILIALSINNWNEQRKNNSKERNYLLSVKRDLNTQLSDIESNVSGETSVIRSLDKALRLYDLSQGFTVTSDLIVSVSPVNDRYTFSRISTTFDEIQSAGDLELIRNQGIKDALSTYYARLKRTEDVISNNARQANNTISLRTLGLTEISGPSVNFQKSTLVGSFDDYETPDYLLNLIRKNLEKPENALALLNCIRLRKNIANWHIKKYHDLKVETQTLLLMIESYL